jgi:MFS family permease
MAIAAGATDLPVAWWKEPTKDQWLAWIAAWLGWTLDAFDFTIFLLIMAPIAKEFGVSVTAVAAVLTFTLWLRFVGAVGSGWLADRIGRKTPLMLSILWYSACNFIAGFSPTFSFLFVVRALLGIGMGAEWPAGASLAMEVVAGSLTRLDERCLAGVVESRLCALYRGLLVALRRDRLARTSLAWHSAGVRMCVHPILRERACSLGGEPQAAT